MLKKIIARHNVSGSLDELIKILLDAVKGIRK